MGAVLDPYISRFWSQGNPGPIALDWSEVDIFWYLDKLHVRRYPNLDFKGFLSHVGARTDTSLIWAVPEWRLTNFPGFIFTSWKQFSHQSNIRTLNISRRQDFRLGIRGRVFLSWVIDSHEKRPNVYYLRKTQRWGHETGLNCNPTERGGWAVS